MVSKKYVNKTKHWPTYPVCAPLADRLMAGVRVWVYSLYYRRLGSGLILALALSIATICPLKRHFCTTCAECFSFKPNNKMERPIMSQILLHTPPDDLILSAMSLCSLASLDFFFCPFHSEYDPILRICEQILANGTMTAQKDALRRKYWCVEELFNVVYMFAWLFN